MHKLPERWQQCTELGMKYVKVLQCNLLPVINWRPVTLLSVNHLWMTFIKHFPHLTTHSEYSFKLVCPNLEAKANCLCKITYCDVFVWNIMFGSFTSTEAHNIYIRWLLFWRWRECIPHKYWYLSTRLHGVTSQVNVILPHRTCCAMMKPWPILLYWPNIFLVKHKNATNFFYNAQFLIRIPVGTHQNMCDMLPLQ